MKVNWGLLKGTHFKLSFSFYLFIFLKNRCRLGLSQLDHRRKFQIPILTSHRTQPDFQQRAVIMYSRYSFIIYYGDRDCFSAMAKAEIVVLKRGNFLQTLEFAIFDELG